MTGNCTCTAGWMGEDCSNACDVLHYGVDCSQDCMCLNKGVCDRFTGNCSCTPGYLGQFCGQECPEERYGPGCSQMCQCKNNASCEFVDGRCNCEPGWTGTFCDTVCPDGTYGSYCTMNCSCLNGATCGKQHGDCTCVPGFTGLNCETRIPTTAPPTTEAPTTAAPTCPPNYCSNGGSCEVDRGSPVCTCTVHWMGSQCSEPAVIPPECINPSFTDAELERCINNINIQAPGELKGPDDLTTGQKTSIALGILIPLIIAVIIGVAFYCCYKRKSKKFKDFVYESDMTFNNPTYGQLPTLRQYSARQRATEFDNPAYAEVLNNNRRRGTDGYEQPFQAQAVARNPFYASLTGATKGKGDNVYESTEDISPYDNRGSLSANRNTYDNPTDMFSSGSTTNPYDNSGSLLRGNQDGNVYDNRDGSNGSLYEEL